CTDGIDDISVFHSNFCPLLQAFLAILRRYFTVATWMSPVGQGGMEASSVQQRFLLLLTFQK
ncbi:hypothetical protein BXA18_22040, partial [Acinetobacter baumannii]